MAFAFQEAEDDVAMASNTMEDAVAALKQWELDYPTAAATKAATEIGGKVADTAANALLTSIFGESKSAKEARLKKEKRWKGKGLGWAASTSERDSWRAT